LFGLACAHFRAGRYSARKIKIPSPFQELLPGRLAGELMEIVIVLDNE
jgi:hypothetical protein